MRNSANCWIKAYYYYTDISNNPPFTGSCLYWFANFCFFKKECHFMRSLVCLFLWMKVSLAVFSHLNFWRNWQFSVRKYAMNIVPLETTQMCMFQYLKSVITLQKHEILRYQWHTSFRVLKLFMVIYLQKQKHWSFSVVTFLSNVKLNPDGHATVSLTCRFSGNN